MNNSERSTTEEDDLKIGTVLFTAGDANHADVWDDSELIDHWDRTIEVWRTRYATENQVADTKQLQPKKNIKTSRVSAISKRYQNLPRSKPTKPSTKPQPKSKPKQQQPQSKEFVPPASNQDDLSNLMMAWYYCGYYTALYQAQKN